MPFQTNGKRDYTKELQWEKTSKPERAKHRAARNKAREEAIKQGKARVGDGKHVDHVVPLSKGGSANLSNTRVIPAKANLARVRRNKDGSLK